MPNRYPPIVKKFPHFLHGGDYNPDQWPRDVWDEDMRLMKLANCNAMTVGIFSWVQLEPREGVFTFGWLDEIMDKLAANDAVAVLATPSASHPAWMAQKYPEVQRTNIEGVRQRYCGRVNFCLTSPVYREKAAIITEQLATRYKNHPALAVWHVHNEYGGACHCTLCQEAFRDWLRAKYKTLEELNHAWWTAFWGHTFTDWNQIVYGDTCMIGSTLDWKRFITDQTIACYKNEADILHRITPGVPVTTNTYWHFVDYDWRRWAPHLDVIAWDNYPMFHDRDDDLRVAVESSWLGDFYRCMKDGRPFMLMESTPSSTNWMPVMKLKRPGLHQLSSLQAIAHGADTVQYFQWRNGRGGAEKFHGAVVDHDGRDDTRVFNDVAELGKVLQKIEPVLGTTVKAEVAIVFDKETSWAIDAVQGPRREQRDYFGTSVAHYRTFWKRSAPVDILHQDQDFTKYKLLIAPMVYLVRPHFGARVEKFVRAGGTFVSTYWSGIADENDLCFLGGFPGPLRKVLGIRSEELDVLYDDEAVTISMAKGNPLGLSGQYEAKIFCDLIHAEKAEVLATYKGEFYAGRPALTVNAVGKGRAYYMASRNDDRFMGDFYDALIKQLGLRRVLNTRLPKGVTAQCRTDGKRQFVFLMNFSRKKHTISLGKDKFANLLTGEPAEGAIKLPPHGSTVLERLAGD